jgi:hypothetical protein
MLPVEPSPKRLQIWLPHKSVHGKEPMGQFAKATLGGSANNAAANNTRYMATLRALRMGSKSFQPPDLEQNKNKNQAAARAKRAGVDGTDSRTLN